MSRSSEAGGAGSGRRGMFGEHWRVQVVRGVAEKGAWYSCSRKTCAWRWEEGTLRNYVGVGNDPAQVPQYRVRITVRAAHVLFYRSRTSRWRW